MTPVRRHKLPPSGGLAIFLNKLTSTPSIALKLLIYFVSTGTLLFGILLVVFLLNSQRFADQALLSSMQGITQEMASTLYVNERGDFQLDDSEVKLKWGFDALYSNLAFRLIDIDSQKIVMTSMPLGTQGYLFNDIVSDIPLEHSRIETGRVSLYRLDITLENRHYYFDVARSDLLAELANEAVGPAIINIGRSVIIVAFLIFLALNFIAIKLIIKPANALTVQIEGIKPEDLEQRIDVNDVPIELLPIATAMNAALQRVEQSFNEQKRFIADAAHELRTPLTIFLNRLELKIPSSTAKDELINDARFISRIVEQLLDLSRAQNRNGHVTSQIKLVAVVKNVCSHLAPMAIDKGQDLELSDDGNEATIKVDEGELTVVVKNLLENAIKYSPEGAKIKVSIDNRILLVEDSGDGLPETQQMQIFERFWRANQSDRAGSGLGLAITKEILSHYNATITADNHAELGGARFRVEFS